MILYRPAYSRVNGTHMHAVVIWRLQQTQAWHPYWPLVIAQRATPGSKRELPSCNTCTSRLWGQEEREDAVEPERGGQETSLCTSGIFAVG